MGKGLGNNGAAALTLQRVVADCAGRIQCLFHVAGFQYVSGLVGTMRPDSGKAIGLELKSNRKCITFDAVKLAFHRLNLARYPEQILYVMTDLMSNDIRLSEISGCFESGTHVIVESQIDIGFPVGRAVERSHRCLSQPARRTCRAAEQHQRWCLVALAGRGKYVRPDIFSIGDDNTDHIRKRVVTKVVCGRAYPGRRCLTAGLHTLK